MRRVEVVISDVIDEHVLARFYLHDDHGKRQLGSLAVHHQDLWIIEHMIRAAEQSAEETSLFDGLTKVVEFSMKVGP
jgi:hypothetical protein